MRCCLALRLSVALRLNVVLSFSVVLFPQASSVLLQPYLQCEHSAAPDAKVGSLYLPVVVVVVFFSFQWFSLLHTLHYITAAVGRAHVAPTQTIATPCGPVLPLLPLKISREVQSLAGLSTLYLSIFFNIIIIIIIIIIIAMIILL